MKLMKRMVTVLLVCVLTITSIPMTVFGYDAQEEEVVVEEDISQDDTMITEEEQQSDSEEEQETILTVPSEEKVSSLDGTSISELKGEGTAENPYEISSVEELAALPDLLENEYEKYGEASFILTDDIDGKDYTKSLKPIGTEEHPFNGELDGNGKTISNFKIGDKDEDNQGLFGNIAVDGWIINIGIQSCEVVGNCNVGGIAAKSDGYIINSYYSGMVLGSENIGEIVGYFDEHGTVNNCFSYVMGDADLCGFVGNEYGLCGCYQITSLSEKDMVVYSVSNQSTAQMSKTEFADILNQQIREINKGKYYWWEVGNIPTHTSIEPRWIMKNDVESSYEESAVGGTDDYKRWSQGDHRWGDFSMTPGYCKMSGDGCAVTGVLKLMVQAGLANQDLVNPGTFCQWLCSHGGFQGPTKNSPLGSDIIWSKAAKYVNGFYCLGTHRDCNILGTNGWNALKSKIMDNRSILVYNGAGHWIAVDSAASINANNLIIMNNGAVQAFSSCYPGGKITNYAEYSGGNPRNGAVNSSPTPPSKPTVNCPQSVGANKDFQIQCNASGKVTRYKAEIFDSNNNLVSAKSDGGTIVLKVANPGNYRLDVYAINDTLWSGVTSVNFAVKEDVKVIFADWDGSILKNETAIPYGSNAVAPVVADRTGYNFTGWSSSTSNITKDTLFTAQYTKRKYTVKFYLEDGVTLLSAQTVEYGDAAKEPVYPEDKLRTGYVFETWSQKTDFVESNMNISPVIAWGNVYLPVVASITSAQKVVDPDDTNSIVGYTANIHMVCTPDNLTKGRAVVSLKTANGKMVASTESAAFYIFKDSQRDLEVFVPYEDVVTKLEVIIVDGYSLNTPYSETALYEIPDDTQEWSGWKEGTPEEGYRDDQVEYRTEYSYRDKQFTTTTNDAMTGWELLSNSEGWSDYGAWSGWQDTAVAANDTTKVETRRVQNTGAYTQYNYYSYHSNNASVNYKWTHFCPVAGRSYYGGTWSRCESGWTNTYVAPSSLGQNHGYGCSCGNPGGAMVQYSYGGWKYYYCQTRTIPATYKTQYRYATRSWQKENTFWKWGDYTEWSPEVVTSAENREVKTREVYRTFGRIIDMENSDSVTRTVSGNLSPELAGKQLILMIYKVDEASDYSNEYVGQTIIGEDGSYSFEFITREEPSVKTGDFTVALSIEGSTAPIYLDPIIAPKPVYTVAFEDWNGNPIGEPQQVKEGDSAVSPEEPTREGYYFAGWDTGLNNVHYDMIVTANYKPVMYTIIYKDWDGSILDIQQTGFGEILTPPALVGNAERSYTGWDIEDAENYVVEGDMTLTAQSVINKYTVNFYQESGALIKTEEVEYGKSATPPSDPVRANSKFEGWSEDGAYAYVTGDLDLYPIFTYTSTTETPIASIKSGVYSNVQEVALSCATSGANIYYTTDGDDPYYEGELYAGPITIDSDTELRMVATRLEMNDSAEVVCEYEMKSPLLISNCEIEDIADQTYSGKAITPQIVIKDGGKILKENEHYTVTFSNNIAVGAASAFITGIGLYEGSLEANFSIVNTTKGTVSLAGAKIGKIKQVTYTGQVCKPSISVKMDGKKLNQYVDYQIAYKRNINAGMASATIIGCGSYSGTKTVDFMILPAKINKANVSGLDKVTDLDGDAKGVEAVVTVGSKILTENSDYELSYKNNSKAGKATVIISGINNYKGKISKKFKIGKVNINNCVSAYDGNLNLEYTGSTIMPGVYLTYNEYELQEGKDYKIKYSKNMKIGKAKMVVSGKGNFDGKMELEFSIVARDMANLWDITVQDVAFNGLAQEPSVVIKNVKGRLKKNKDFYTVFSNNVEKGTATVTIYGKGNYVGQTSASFRIVDKLIAKAKIGKIPSQVYTGRAITPNVNVEVKGKTLTPNEDYIITYQGNIEKGTAKAIITGINEYGGSRVVNFKIK